MIFNCFNNEEAPERGPFFCCLREKQPESISINVYASSVSHKERENESREGRKESNTREPINFTALRIPTLRTSRGMQLKSISFNTYVRRWHAKSAKMNHAKGAKSHIAHGRKSVISVLSSLPTAAAGLQYSGIHGRFVQCCR